MITLLLCSFATAGYAQLHLDDPDYTYQTEAGEVIAKDKVNELLHSKQHYSLKEEAQSDGKFIVTLVPISDQEFRKIIKEKKALAKEMNGEKVPDFNLKDRNGNAITHHTFDKRKVTVYNFWFTTCPHCIEEIPKLNEIVKDFGDEVTFIAPTFNTHTQVAKFLENNTFDYQIVTNAKSLAQEMHIRSYPAHYLVDEEGIIRKIIIGSSNHVIKKIRRNIKKLLKK